MSIKICSLFLKRALLKVAVVRLEQLLERLYSVVFAAVLLEFVSVKAVIQKFMSIIMLLIHLLLKYMASHNKLTNMVNQYILWSMSMILCMLHLNNLFTANLIKLCLLRLNNLCMANLIKLCLLLLNNLCMANLIKLCLLRLNNLCMANLIKLCLLLLNNLCMANLIKLCLLHLSKICMALHLQITERHQVNQICLLDLQLKWMLNKSGKINLVMVKRMIIEEKVKVIDFFKVFSLKFKFKIRI